MPSSTLGPGSRFAGRYVLKDHVVEAAGTSYWRAVDETLGRAVGVRTVQAGTPLAGRVAEAARMVAGIEDARFLRVLDVDDERDQVFVVSEWVEGRSLEELLHMGPLVAEEAARVVRESAEALAAAHRLGLAHRCLRPSAVLVTATGQVRITGLGLDATLLGLPAVAAAEARREDARGCGRLLYAALTARWPASEDGMLSDLPSAPSVEDRPVAPRQVRGGIPPRLDSLACRALGRPAHRQGSLDSPAEVAAALAALDLPAVREYPSGFDPGLSDEDSATRPIPLLIDGAPETPGGPDGAAGPTVRESVTPSGRWLAAVVGLVLAVLALLGWAVLSATGGLGPAGLLPLGPGRAPGAAGTNPSAAAADAGTVIPIVSARDFDPEGNGEEHHDQVPLAFDGKPSTAWTTLTYYGRADLGGLKQGVGLVLDLGQVRTIGSVTLDLVGRGTTLQLGTANSYGASRSDYTTVATATVAGTSTTLRLSPPVQARYLLVWLTRLPADPLESTPTQPAFRGGIAEILLRR